MSYGVIGNYMQPQGHIQVLLNILRGLNVQAALDAPRFCIDGGPIAFGGLTTSKVFIEEGISPNVVDELRGKSPFLPSRLVAVSPRVLTCTDSDGTPDRVFDRDFQEWVWSWADHPELQT